MDTEVEATEPSGPSPAKLWLDRIAESEQAFDKWRTQCANVDKLYSRNERADAADREYAIFWANIEVLKPATYARPPVPVVAPRFKDGDPLAREASETLERALVVAFEQGDVDGLMREVRDEFLRYARGTARVRLAGPNALAFDHIAHCDFVHELARTWREVTWAGHRAWLTRDQGLERFGEAFAHVELKKRDENAAIPDKGDKAPVWEIWDKTSGNVIWVAGGCEYVLDEQPAAAVLADLRDFWPYPKPAYGTIVPGSLLPVPEIRQYKDQLEEINEYTARIAALSQAMKLRGFYQAGAGDISEAIEAAVKSLDDRAVLIPISSQVALGPGGLKDAVIWLPVDQVAALVKELVELRRVVIEDVYQITGISDIVRGQTEASETLGAQQLKSQWGSLRIRERQNELVRFARDLTRIAGEVIAENFDPATLFEMAQSQLPDMATKAQAQAALAQAQQPQVDPMTGQPMPPQVDPALLKQAQKVLKQPTKEEVAAFLANDRVRGFTIEIETDSTIQPDEDAEKQRRVEFGTSVGGMFQQAVPVIQALPQAAPFLGEVLKFMAAGFRAGRSLEGAIEQFVEVLEGVAEAASQPKPPQPNPKLEAENVKLDAIKTKAAADSRAIDRKEQIDEAKHGREMQKLAMQAVVASQTPEQIGPEFAQ